MQEVIHMFASLMAGVLVSGSDALTQVAESPSPRVGDVREYQTFDDWTSQLRLHDRMEIIGSLPAFLRIRTESRSLDLKTNLMEVKPVEDDTIRSDLNVDYVTRFGTMRRLNYSWPISSGKKWSYEYAVELPGGTQSQPLTATYKVSAEAGSWESVATPAGVFKAIKVTHKGVVVTSNQPSVQAKLAWTMWYAPQINTTVKIVFQADSPSGVPGARTTTLLSAFKPGE